VSDAWNTSYSRNPYYDPAACGLDLVAVLDEADMSYEFNTIIFVKDQATGKFYAAHDSGCSCPSPFENLKGLDDMVPINNAATMEDFIRSQHGFGAKETIDFMRKVREVL
jgi:hypothetical protein